MTKTQAIASLYEDILDQFTRNIQHLNQIVPLACATLTPEQKKMLVRTADSMLPSKLGASTRAA